MAALRFAIRALTQPGARKAEDVHEAYGVSRRQKSLQIDRIYKTIIIKMKRIVLSALLATALIRSNAAPIVDTVSIGASYANQVWYSLENDEQGNAPKNNWDIAFDATGFGSSIMINSVTGTMVWKYPNADTAGWATIDTTGISTWEAHWNSDTSWSGGAIGNYPDPNDQTNLDWGVYNQTTHIVTGDSLYIVQLANGGYKKLWVISLASGVYTFKYANLDGSNEQTQTLDKTGYTDKNFGYFSIQGDSALDREPVSADWDLVFTQHTAFIPTAYTVTGVLGNTGVELVKCSNLTDKATFTDWQSQTFKTEINVIGYNWKSFNGTGYDIKDSTVYFVKPLSGDIWKIIFTGFSGSGAGSYMFSKEKLHSATSVEAITGTKTTVALYPNPASNQAVNVVYSISASVPSASIIVNDITGKTVFTADADNNAGFHQYQIPAQTLRSGIYIVTVKTANTLTQQKLVVQ